MRSKLLILALSLALCVACDSSRRTYILAPEREDCPTVDTIFIDSIVIDTVTVEFPCGCESHGHHSDSIPGDGRGHDKDCEGDE